MNGHKVAKTVRRYKGLMGNDHRCVRVCFLGKADGNIGVFPRSRVLLDTRLIHDSWRKGCRDERTKARGGFGGGRPQGERSQGPRASQ